MPDYQGTRRHIENKIEEMRCDIAASPNERSVRIFSHRFQLLSLEGDLPGSARLALEMEAASSDSPGCSDLLLLRAAVAIKLHRLNEAEACLLKNESLWNSNAALLLRADLHVQQGRYLAARAVLDMAATNEPTWDGYSRLAYLTALFGDIDEADRFYARAQDELTAKQMHLFAWLDLQRGFMFFERGQHQRAMAYYRRADATFPGYWLSARRIAEVKGAQGEFAEAIASYRQLYDGSARPEWAQAVGDLCALAGSQSEAHDWRLEALKGYTATINRGEVYHYHALVDLCCEIAGQTSTAIGYARKDVALRSNHATEGDLAWALYRNGDTAEARECIEKALSYGIVTARLYTQAACIYAAANQLSLSKGYLQRARQVNPTPGRAKINFTNTRTPTTMVRAGNMAITAR